MLKKIVALALLCISSSLIQASAAKPTLDSNAIYLFEGPATTLSALTTGNPVNPSSVALKGSLMPPSHSLIISQGDTPLCVLGMTHLDKHETTKHLHGTERVIAMLELLKKCVLHAEEQENQAKLAAFKKEKETAHWAVKEDGQWTVVTQAAPTAPAKK